MVNNNKVLIAVAPNGARRGKSDHPALPISPSELAECAVECLEAGAGMLHLHVRDEGERHTIAPQYYEPALQAIGDAVGDKLIVQVTSESAERYGRHQQMSAINSLAPECVSIAMRELIPCRDAWADAETFLSNLRSGGTLVQIILYDPKEVYEYDFLIEKGVIPSPGNFLLFVLGRKGPEPAPEVKLKRFIDANVNKHRWMCCAFGAQESSIMEQVMGLGGHPRVGFENNICLPDGTLAESNRQSVVLAKDAAIRLGRDVVTAAQGRGLF